MPTRPPRRDPVLAPTSQDDDRPPTKTNGTDNPTNTDCARMAQSLGNVKPSSGPVPPATRPEFARLLLEGATIEAPNRDELLMGETLVRPANVKYILERDSWWANADDVVDFLDDVRAELVEIRLPPSLSTGFFDAWVPGTLCWKRRIDRIRSYCRRRGLIEVHGSLLGAEQDRGPWPDESAVLRGLVDELLIRAGRKCTPNEFAVFTNHLAPLAERQPLAADELARHVGVSEKSLGSFLKRAREKLADDIRELVGEAVDAYRTKD